MTPINVNMERPVHRLGAVVLAAALALGNTACTDFLDVNTNPNAPINTSANNYLAPMIHWLATSEQYDGRYVGRYTQMWMLPSSTVGGSPSDWDRHGYAPGSDAAAQLYRDVYWNFGINLSNMILQSEEEERWDLAGAGYVLRAWGWLKLTDLHGDIIIQEAFTPDQFRFPFDSQEFAYEEILRLLDQGIEYLSRTDGNISPSYMEVGDKLFNGSTDQWLKFAWGLKAMALNHFSNKASYDPGSVIAAVDNSFTSNDDEALFTYPASDPVPSNDHNFWSLERGNLGSYRQTTFIVGLMDGTQYGGAVDPRMSRMLAQDSTGAYRGLDPAVGYGSVTSERPWNLWGYYGTGRPADGLGRYLFDRRPQFPIMTYAQLQFIKAEAALNMGDQGLARQAYLNGISAHIDFVNARNAEIENPDITPISDSEKDAFLNHPAIAPATITLSHIMGQKLIAQFGWAFVEAWMDLRRYHYTDMDPVAGTQVFRGYTLPTDFYPDNNQKPVQRIRPRYNSDYVWNRDELAKITPVSGLALDYHTSPLWITEP